MSISFSRFYIRSGGKEADVAGSEILTAARAGAQIETTSLSSSLPASRGSPLYPSDSSRTIYQDPSHPATTTEDFDSPLIVPPPGQILRRNARTKIRKTGPGGEVSFGHRTGAGGGSRLGLRARNSTDGSGISFAGGEESSTDSHETEDLRASTSSLNSLGGGAQRPVSAPQVESPPLDGPAQYLEIAPSVPNVEQSSRRTSSSSTEVSISQVPPPVAKPISPPPPPPPPSQPESIVSPASAEYDWASQHLPQPAPTPSAPPPPSQQTERQQYAVHPSHGHSLPPTPQAVPIPVPQPERERERERSNSVSSIGSSKSSIVSHKEEKKETSGVKEKKSGWAAKLGLGGGGDDKKKKGKSKETINHHSHQHNEKNEQVMHVEDHKPAHSTTKDKAKEKDGTSNSLFGGLFGRRRTEYDSPPTPSPSTTPATPLSNALAPPPPPTASGALLPNGRYANFYRLPIHVERAIYRLSHIKLANPRRPLYEQVLISNLMCKHKTTL